MLLLICWLGFGLRLYDLAGQSMWSDEGLSYYRAQQATATVLANTITVDGVRTVDTNPPFYFLLLHGWRALFGESVFNLRLMGVYAATLAIPLMAVTGTALFGRRAGLLAALFIAISPFHVWQTQILRNYGLLITLNLFAVYGLLRTLNSPPGAAGRRKWAALWLGAGLIGIYTHYFGFFIFAFTLFAYTIGVLWTQRGRWQAGRNMLLGLFVIAALLAPAVLAAWARFRAGRQFDFFAVDPWGVALQAISAFGVGMSPTLTHAWPLVTPGLILFIGGILVGLRLRRGAVLLLIGYQVAPLALLLALSTINPLFNGTRHLLIGLPPFLLLCAALPALVWQRRGARSAWSRAGLVLAVLFLTLQVIWLQRQFHDRVFVRDDVRAAALYLNKMAAPDDYIVLHDTLIKFTFDAYYRGAAPVTSAPLFGRLDEAAETARLQDVVEQARRVWFLTHPQPRTGFARDGLLRWAEENWHRLHTVDFEWLWLPVRLRAYSAQPQISSLPSQATALDVLYENGLALHGYQLPADLASGEPFVARFFLSRQQQPAPASASENFEISLRFLDAEGRLWRQIDQGLWPAYPMQQWPDNSLLRYDHITELPSGLPPGQYQVWLRLVNREQNYNLALTGGGVDVHLSDVTVSAASCDEIVDPWPTYVEDDIFYGRSLLLEGHAGLAQQYRPGHLLSMELLWCVLRPPGEDLRVQTRLTNAKGDVVAQSEEALTRADYPPDAWQRNQLLQGRVNLPLPAALSAGLYDLQLTVLNGEPGRAALVNLGLGGRAATVAQIAVEEWPVETTFPTIATPMRADFEDPPLFELHGYELGTDTLAPGESTKLTFYWRAAVDAPPVNYYAFVHVIQEGQPPAAQADGPPLNGFRPTSSWREGAVFVDERTLAIPHDAPEGEYRLTVGFYNPDTGVRLPAFVQGQRQKDDAVILQTMSIER